MSVRESLGVGVDVCGCTRVGVRVDMGAVLRNTFAHAHTHTQTPSVFTYVAALGLCLLNAGILTFSTGGGDLD